MNHEKSKRRTRPPLADALHDDDGVDPRKYLDRRQRKEGEDRKLLMLCSQVAVCLGLSLEGELNDPRLEGIHLESVTPAPDASRLEVLIGIPQEADSAEVLAALNGAAARLRVEVAAVIHRKKAPQLAFRLLRDAP